MREKNRVFQVGKMACAKRRTEQGMLRAVKQVRVPEAEGQGRMWYKKLAGKREARSCRMLWTTIKIWSLS